MYSPFLSLLNPFPPTLLPLPLPRSRRPLIGQLPEFANREPKPIPASEPAPLGPATVSPLLWKWRCQLGTVFGLSIGPFQPLIVAEPDLFHQILIAKNSSFQKNQNARRVVSFLANGLVFSDGAFWARQRKMISPAFSPSYLKVSAVALPRSAARLTSSTGSTERFFSGRFLIPLYTWLPTQENRALQQAGEKVKRLCLDLIARRRQEQAGAPRRDLLAVMLAARDDVSNEQMTDQQLVDECVTFLVAGTVRNEQMTNQQLVDECVTFLVAGTAVLNDGDGCRWSARGDCAAVMWDEVRPSFFHPSLPPIPSGHETTAKLLTWTVYLLARYPEWQRRVREEGDRRRGGGGKVTWEQVGRLSEMHMVLLETLRLFPPTPAITREASKDVSLGPYSLPAGTRITMAIALVHSDPRFWGKDALEFNPARFKDGIQGACSHPQAFLPFSAGPRDCIGSNFALSEAKVVLAHMVSRLEWELSPTYVHLPTMGIALSPKYGMPLRMRLVE
ncbi:unnamed protein product [Closterium sp. Yama58-4]|nr:unnamed protein product [Closterium sp. Yama58-4]